MWPRFGIKLGNSTFSIALAKKDEKVEIIANKQGDRVTSAVCLRQNDVLEVAPDKQKLSSKPNLTITNNFQLFPVDTMEDSDIENALKFVPCSFNLETKKYVLISNEENSKELTISPYEVCVEFFKACYELAQHCSSSLPRPIAVISIPHYYNQCWEKLSEAAEEAGFQASQVLTESTASLIAYEFDEDDKGKNSVNVLCIKSGGINSDFVLYNVFRGYISAIDSAGPFKIGGNMITDAVVDFICQEFQKKYHLNPKESKRSKAKVRIAADNCKHVLTTMPSTQVYIESLMDGVDFSIQLSRARFESLIQPVLNKFISILTTAVEKINRDNHKIHEIVVIGGNMKIPKLQSMIGTLFPEAKFNLKHSPDEVIAIGCGRQSLFIDEEIQELKQTSNISFTSNDIFIWEENAPINIDEEYKLLICKKGTAVPNTFKLEVKTNNILETECCGDKVKEVNYKIQLGDDVCEVAVENPKVVKNKYLIQADLQIAEDKSLKITLISQ